MPRGKVANQSLHFKADVSDDAVREEENKGSAKFVLIEPEAEDKDEDEEDNLVQSVHNDFTETLESSRPNFKFTLLLVTLFVAVNFSLITLLDNNRHTTPPTSPKDETVGIEAPKMEITDRKRPPVERPVLAAPAEEVKMVEKPVSEKAVSEKPALEKQAVSKPAVSHPGAEQDLLSIINKD